MIETVPCEAYEKVGFITSIDSEEYESRLVIKVDGVIWVVGVAGVVRVAGVAGVVGVAGAVGLVGFSGVVGVSGVAGVVGVAGVAGSARAFVWALSPGGQGPHV